MRDRDIRLAIRSALEAAHAQDDDTRVVEEMGIWAGSVRVDVAVINGELAGFELKSSKDTLIRLPQQAFFYSEVFDRMTIVAAENHLDCCMSMIPLWWGVTIAYSEANGAVALDSYRATSANPSQNPLQIARLLWKSEAVDVLDSHGLVKGYRSKGIDVIHERVAKEIPLDLLKSEVRARLKSRSNWI